MALVPAFQLENDISRIPKGPYRRLIILHRREILLKWQHSIIKPQKYRHKRRMDMLRKSPARTRKTTTHKRAMTVCVPELWIFQTRLLLNFKGLLVPAKRLSWRPIWRAERRIVWLP